MSLYFNNFNTFFDPTELIQGMIPCNTLPRKCGREKRKSKFAIVNRPRFKLLEFPRQILAALGNPTYVKILFKQNFLILKATDKSGFPLRARSAKGCIYCSELVQEISKRFNLNFSYCGGRMEFPDFIIIPDDTITAVAIQIN